MESSEQTENVQNAEPPQVGMYGWRKRCLYLLIFSLGFVGVINFWTTIFVLKAINFNLGGLGRMTVTSSGVELRDYSNVLGSLVTSHVSSRYREPLSCESSYNMSLVIRDETGLPSQELLFWSNHREPNRLEVTASSSQFRVHDLNGRALFTAEADHVSLGVDALKVLEGGARFTGSVQTSMIRSSLGHELMLESATRKLLISAPAGVTLESRAADISVSCLTTLKMFSSDGKIKLKAPGIYIPNLESISLLKPQPTRYVRLEPPMASRAYQMCMCSNGKLFVSLPNGECNVDNDGVQCR